MAKVTCSALTEKLEKCCERLRNQETNKLTLNDVQEQFDKILELLESSLDYRSEEVGEALATLQYLQTLVTDVNDHQAVVKSLAAYLAAKGYGQIFVKIAISLQSHILKDFQSTYNFYVLCEGFRDFTDDCPDLGKDFGHLGGIEAMLQCVSYFDTLYQESDRSKSCDENHQFLVGTMILQTIIGIFYNCYRSFPDNRAIYRNANVISTFEQKLKSRDMKVRIFSVMLLATIADEYFCERVSKHLECVLLVVELLKRAVNSDTHFLNIVDDHSDTCISSKEMLQVLNHLAISDANKEKIILFDGHLALVEVMFDPDFNGDERQLATEVLWRLAFVERIRNQLSKEELLQAVAANTRDSAHTGVKTSSAYALWELLDHRIDFEVEQSDKIDVLISFQDASTEQANVIRDKLSSKGFKVALNGNNFEEVDIETMSTTVKRAAVVLILVTEKYKESCCCRSEAYHASKLGKPIFALFVDSKYEPDGWLGKLVENRTSYRLSTDKEVEKNLKALTKEIHLQCKIAEINKDDENTRLTPEEVKEMIDQALDTLSGRDDFSTKEVKQVLEVLHSLLDLLPGEADESLGSNTKNVAECLHRYGKMFVKMACSFQKSIQNTGETAKTDLITNFTTLFAGFQNAADDNKDLCRYFGENGGVDVMVWFLTYLDRLLAESDAENCDLIRELLWNSIGILYNCIRVCRDNQSVYKRANVEEVLRQIKSSDKIVKVDSFLIQSFLGCKNEANELPPEEDVRMLIELLIEAVNSDEHEAVIEPDCYSAQELLDGLNALAYSDAIKIAILNLGGLRPVIRMMQPNCTEKEKEMAVKMVWNLAFVGNLTRSKEVSNARKVLQSMLKSTNKNIREAGAFVLWELGKEKHETHTGRPAESNQVLISYQPDSHAAVAMITDKLRNAGYGVLMVENEDRNVTTMTDMVERSSLVLLCVTNRYKESCYCRSEVSHAKRLGRPLIPLILEEDCELDGWLQELTSGNQPYNLVSGSDEETMQKFVDMVEQLLKENGARFTPHGAVNTSSVQQLIKVDTESDAATGVGSYFRSLCFCCKQRSNYDL